MATKYLSPHHSSDDPGGVIREVLLMGPEFPGPAEDVILAWTLRLSVDRDPADAAKKLLETYDLTEGRPATAGRRQRRSNGEPACAAARPAAQAG